MEFKEITAEEFRKFAEKSPYFSFMQTPEIAELRKKSGWTPYYLAVVDTSTISKKPRQKSQSAQKTAKSSTSVTSDITQDVDTSTKSSKILAASLVLAKPTFLGKRTFYTPGGPLLDLENGELTDFFFTHLAAFAREKGGYVLHIDPYYELIERDRDGKIVPGGFDHEKALQNLKNLGFHPLSDTTMPKYLFALDFATDLQPTHENSPKASKSSKSAKSQKLLKSTEAQSATSLTPEAVFSQFKQNTRNLTRRAERQGVTVRELTREELPILKQITASTADRRHFTDQPLSYYQAMYDLFAPRGEIKFLLAEVDATPEPTSDTTPDQTKPSAKIVDASTKSQQPQQPTSPTKIPLSVAMFMLVGHEVVYLYSGSDDRYMKKYNAQYLIQWRMIEYALRHGFTRYNFYGIRGLPDPAAKDYGIYRFKKGFGGHVIELIGSFELPLNRPIYHLHSTLSHLKHLLHR